MRTQHMKGYQTPALRNKNSGQIKVTFSTYGRRVAYFELYKNTNSGGFRVGQNKLKWEFDILTSKSATAPIYYKYSSSKKNGKMGM